MRVLVDGDASPVKELTICLCKEFGVKCIIYMDYSHEYESDYAKVIFCDKGADSVDLKISNECLKNDIVVTQDYGLATVILAKGGKVIHNNGFIIDEKNELTDRLLPFYEQFCLFYLKIFEFNLEQFLKTNKETGSLFISSSPMNYLSRYGISDLVSFRKNIYEKEIDLYRFHRAGPGPCGRLRRHLRRLR